MEGFQAGSAAIGLVGDVVRLVIYIKDVKDALGTIDDDLEALASGLESIKQLYQQLDLEYTQQPHQGMLNEKQEKAWSSLRLTSENGRKNLTRLEKELRKIYGNNPKTLGWVDAFKKQHRLRSRSTKLGEFREWLRMDVNVLQA